MSRLQPTAQCAYVLSQSVKTAGAAQEEGFNTGKKIKGRKRTILVDSMGLLIGATVHSAQHLDHQGMMLVGVWFAAFWQSIQLSWTDHKQTFEWTLGVVKYPADSCQIWSLSALE